MNIERTFKPKKKGLKKIKWYKLKPEKFSWETRYILLQ